MAASMPMNGCRQCLTSRLRKDILRILSIDKQPCRHSSEENKKRKKQTKLDPADERGYNKAWIAKKPFDRIYLTKDFPPPKHTFEDAVQLHKDLADPTMMDNLDDLLYANMDLDMKTKKQTKFMKEINGLIKVPHHFNDKTRRQIAVFCKQEEEKEIAKKMGAMFVGDRSLVEMILSREIPKEDVDYLLCTPEVYTEITDLRKEFRDKMPTKRLGSMGEDIAAMVEFHMTGICYQSRKISDPEGRLQIPIGPMSLTTEQLKENFTAEIEHLLSLRHHSLGPLITRIELIAPPSQQRHILQAARYVEGLTEADFEGEAENEGDNEEIEKGDDDEYNDSDDEGETRKRKTG